MSRKKRLCESDEDNLRKAVRVRGASERAVYEIWNIAQEGTDRTVARGTFQQTVQRGLEPWTSAMHHVKFACADGPDIELPIINLQLCLTKFCSESADFQRALTRALNCSPTLTPILYADEATAGNVLAVNKKRKANLYYMSWVELWHFLKNQSAWLPVTVVQSTALSQIVGGASKVMVEILKLIVSPQNEEGFALSDNLFFKRRTQAWCLGNYDALRSLLSLKGSAGIRPCVYCINVVPCRSDLTQYDDWLRDLAASTGFCRATDAQIFAAADQMTNAVTKKELAIQEKASGITYSPSSLLWDSGQRSKMPPCKMAYDWMHTYLHNGICSLEIFLFLNMVYQYTNITRSLLQEAVVSCAWQCVGSSGHKQTYIKNLFEEKMFEEKFKGQANETSAILPILRYVVDTMLAPSRSIPSKYIDSFLALCDIVSFVRTLQQGLSAVTQRDADYMQKMQRKHHNLFVLAYGKSHLKPKHHHRFHLPAQWKAMGLVLSCEAVEFRHQIFKSGVADRQRKLVNEHSLFSKSILPRLLQTALRMVQETGLHFWQLLPPIRTASIDDHIAFTTNDLKTSSSVSDSV